MTEQRLYDHMARVYAEDRAYFQSRQYTISYETVSALYNEVGDDVLRGM